MLPQILEKSRIIECIWEGIPYYQKARRRGITDNDRKGLVFDTSTVS
jgi:hypothetical protein